MSSNNGKPVASGGPAEDERKTVPSGNDAGLNEKQFDQWNEKCAVPVEGIEVSAFLQRFMALLICGTTPELDAATSYCNEHSPCRLCKERLPELAKLRTADGAPAMFSMNTAAYPPCLHDVARAAKAPVEKEEEVTGILAVHDAPYKTFVGGYPHLNVWVKNTEAPIGMTVQTLNKGMARVFQKYYPLVLGMLREYATEAWLEKLHFLAARQGDITCGDQIESAVCWMIHHGEAFSMADTAFDRAVCAVKAMLDSPSLSVYEADPAHTVYHKCKSNVVDLLALLAPLADDASMVSAASGFLSSRFNSATYMRRVAAPTEHQRDMARKQLGAFTTTVMDRQTAIGEYGALCDPSLNLMPQATPTVLTIVRIQTLSRMRDLLDVIVHGEGAVKSLLINTAELQASAAYTYSEELKGKVKHPFLWMCTIGTTAEQYWGAPTWAQVDTVLPMGDRSSDGKHSLHYLFKLYNLTPRRFIYNCCFPCFLTPEYARVCGAAFEEFGNTHFPVRAMDKRNEMCGAAVHLRADTDELTTPFTVKINGGKPIRITHW